MRPVRLDSLRIVLPLARAGLAQRRQECTVKLRVDRDVLAEAVTWTARSVPVRPPVPVLAGVHLETDESYLLMKSLFINIFQ